jgi:fatty acid desaturase
MKEAMIKEKSSVRDENQRLTVNALPGRSQFRSLVSKDEYGELKRLIVQAGLLQKAPGYYWFKISLTLGLLALSLSLIFFTDRLWLHLINAAFLAGVFTQVSFFVHDAGHYQIFRTTLKNDLLGIFVANFLLGMSYSWWCDNHNRHHAHPNEVDVDPDMNISVLAFSREQARSKTGSSRFISKHQAHLFFPLTLLEAISKRRGVILFLLNRRPKFHRTEVVLTAVHYVWYLTLLFAVLPPWQAVLFIVVHQSLYGVCMAAVFAHNHIGMPLMPKKSGLNFLRREVVTARNLKSTRLTNFWWGGVNYHIEHHLFTNMPRCNLREAQRIVKEFCTTRSIPYHQIGVLQSYKEILRFLYQASTPLRETPTALEAELYYRAEESVY